MQYIATSNITFFANVNGKKHAKKPKMVNDFTSVWLGKVIVRMRSTHRTKRLRAVRSKQTQQQNKREKVQYRCVCANGRLCAYNCVPFRETRTSMWSFSCDRLPKFLRRMIKWTWTQNYAQISASRDGFFGALSRPGDVSVACKCRTVDGKIVD